MPDSRVFVIKIGSNSLVDAKGRLDRTFLASVAAQLAAARKAGWQPVIVTSGAVAAGVARLGLKERPSALPERQALAAVGQIGLSRLWEEVLEEHGIPAAQLLLMYDDFSHRERNQNLTATVRALFAWGVVPVINENDPVATQELLAVGDNDHLSALVATQLGAEILLMLTDIDGVYDADPRENPKAKRIDEIAMVTTAVLAAAGGAGLRGRGGMRSKIESARLAAGAGVTTVIAAARAPEVVMRALRGESVGTRVRGRGQRVDARRRWLAVARRVKGRIHVDGGAAAAVRSHGRSLLPAGVIRVEGRFAVGETVAIVDPAGTELARGLASIAADELERIVGKRMDVAATILGHPLPKAVVHRDDLLVLTHA
ncbi:MAG: glutamate 5-kinase [Planctomycetota bacterium]